MSKGRFLVALSLVALAAIISLTGCGSKADTGVNKDGNVTVNLWSWRTQDEAMWQEVEKRLQAKGEKIHIEFRAVAATEYDATLQTAMNAGEGPDIITARAGGGISKYAQSGVYAPLDEQVQGLKDFNPGIRAQVSASGKTYAVPFAVQTTQIFYNKEIFAKYNLSEPKTWDELVKVADTLKKNGVTPFFMPTRDAWAVNLWIDNIGAEDLPESWVKDLQAGNAKFADKPFVDVLGKFDSLKPYLQKDFVAGNYQDMETAFAQGQAAMIMDGIWAYNTIMKQNPDLKASSFMLPPAMADQRPHLYAFVDGGYALNAKSKVSAAALKVLNYTATLDFGQLYTDMNAEISAVPGAKAKPDQQQLQLALGHYKDNAISALFRIRSPFDGGSPSLSTTLGAQLQGILNAKATPAQAAQKVQDDIASWYPAFKK